MILRDGMRLALVGVFFGVLATLALTPLMKNLLYGVRPAEPGICRHGSRCAERGRSVGDVYPCVPSDPHRRVGSMQAFSESDRIAGTPSICI